MSFLIFVNTSIHLSQNQFVTRKFVSEYDTILLQPNVLPMHCSSYWILWKDHVYQGVLINEDTFMPLRMFIYLDYRTEVQFFKKHTNTSSSSSPQWPDPITSILIQSFVLLCSIKEEDNQDDVPWSMRNRKK